MAETNPPRENLVRALGEAPALETRDTAAGGMPILTGHFAVWDRWTEINSRFEGHFLEKFSPTSMTKTFSEGKEKIRCLFQHGRDPQVGDKPLGAFDRLEADDTGAYYEVPLLDTSYNRDLIPGLKAGLYGASFRFEVVQEDFNQKPARSEHNPNGLPERIVLEARVREGGPVTFPAYADATAGLRSLTDEFIFGRYTEDTDRLAELLEYEKRNRKPNVTVTYGKNLGEQVGPNPSNDLALTLDNERNVEPEPSEATTPTPEPEPSEATTREPGVTSKPRFDSREEWLEWISRT